MREQAVQAMALGIAGDRAEVPTFAHQDDAAAALDALLDFLTEHDMEWKRAAAKWWSRYPEDAARPKLNDLAGLVAALREPE